MSELAVQALEVAYGDAVAVDGVDLHVASGEVVTLLGPSGCGKSTILRVVAGLVEPAAGRVLLDGRDITSLAPHRRSIGLMFQEYALFPHEDVAGNVAFGLRMRGDSRDAIGRRVRDVLALVGLAGFEGRSIASLSGGEQQRVALARSLAPAPKVLMLDEPLGSLDRTLRERLTVELREVFDTVGTTTITVTHDQAEAFTLADRVVVLRAGRVQQSGTPLEVWRRPANGFVARFLGFANVFDVDVRGGRAETPVGAVAARRGDGPACVVVRPDAVRILASEDARVSSVAGIAGPAGFRGDHFVVPVTLESGRTIEVVERMGSVPDQGASVALAVDEDGVVVADP